jgi:outer membrane lipoprotein-sorting protein
MKRAYDVLLLVAFLVAFAACRPPPPHGQDLTPLPSPEKALQMVQAEGRARRSMRAEGRVTYFGDSGRVRLKTVLVVERPGRFRVETISPLEQPIDVMASDGERVWLLSNGKLSEGPATPENIARLLPVPLRADELVDTMLGGVPTSERFLPKDLRWTEDHARWVLSMDGQSGETAELAIDPDKLRVESATLRRPDGEVRLVLRFDDFEALADKGSFPRKIVLEMPKPKAQEVTIKLQEVEVNVDIPPTVLRLEPPPGTVPERLDSPPVRLPPAAG